MAQDVISGVTSMCTWKDSIFYCFWMEYHINIISSYLDCTLLGLRFLIDFLSEWSIHCWGLGVISPCLTIGTCFICWGGPLLGAYLFTIALCSFWIYLLMGCIISFLSFVKDFILKSHMCPSVHDSTIYSNWTWAT